MVEGVLMTARENNCVVVSRARPLDYRRDYVALPRNYGSPAYNQREDVQAIRQLVQENLNQLDERTGFLDLVRGKKIVIKPNLVSVLHAAGLPDRDYPESTDPRVLDAVVGYLKQYSDRVVIVESSGRGIPTRYSFKVAGIDRLARHHGAELQCLEEQPVDRYILPKARVMKEMIVPRIFSEVIAGEAFYISIPKMKTNIYTDVTLGFKNAMGVISYNLRQRNHNHLLDQKLVDMLYLFQPGLTIIDGLVGGEGNCPAPVFPVDSRVLISGTNSVETDRVATQIMGFNPEQVRLMQLAREMGFGDPHAEVLGDLTPISFRKPDPSLLGEAVAQMFPNLKVLVGFTGHDAPPVRKLEEVRPATVREMETACRGGCMVTARFNLDVLSMEGLRRDFALVLIVGNGVCLDGQTWYFDRAGKAFNPPAIRQLQGKKLAFGSCTRSLAPIADQYIEGCLPAPSSPHSAIHKLSGQRCVFGSLKNRHLLDLLFSLLQMNAARKHLIRSGTWLDCDFPVEDKLFIPRAIETEDVEREFIRWDFPRMSPEEKRHLLQRENEALNILL